MDQYVVIDKDNEILFGAKKFRYLMYLFKKYKGKFLARIKIKE